MIKCIVSAHPQNKKKLVSEAGEKGGGGRWGGGGDRELVVKYDSQLWLQI